MNVLKINTRQNKLPKWYFGGISATGAACISHPMDLLKVQMQTQKGKNISFMMLVRNILRKQGIRGFYNGISASLLRQITYSTARFGIYEVSKQKLASKDRSAIPFITSAVLAGLGGIIGGLVGNPADVVNVRMQNDIKLPPEQRRNYKNVLHGLYNVVTNEGVRRLWAGGTANCARAALMTIGQLSFYEQAKALLLQTSYFVDNVVTHISASVMAGAIATTITQPVDVIKTRIMNARPGEVNSMLSLVTTTAKESPLAFFKGYMPAFVRIAPHTILTFVFFEQLRMKFGIDTLEVKKI